MKTVYLVIGLLFISLSVNAYTLNYAKTPIKKTLLNDTIPFKFYSNVQLFNLINNLSCREYSSTGIQSGCSIFKEKILVSLGKKPEKFAVGQGATATNYKTRMFCFKDMGGYIEFGPGYHIELLKDYKEIDLNRTIYPKGVRIYERHFILNNNSYYENFTEDGIIWM